VSRVLITGLGGFLGSHLAEYLRGQGHDVAGTVHRGGLPPDFVGDEITAIPCDILDSVQVEDAVKSSRAEVIFHLAAQSLLALSWQDPRTTFQVNILGALYLLEAVRKAGLDPVIMVAGSSAEYGTQPDGRGINEGNAVRPCSPYGASKAAAGLLAAFYADAFRMKVVCIRPFQAIGPRKVGDVCSDLARGIVAVERGLRPALSVGNLEAVRDFLDVRDVVRACWTIAERGTTGQVYNICSGVGHSVRELLEMLLSHATGTVTAKRDLSRLRPSDQPVVVGDNSRLRALGWQPTVPLERSLSDILDYWRTREREAAPASVPVVARGGGP